jgi:glycosyltransferase involved in cell wall biosynthesis
MSSSTPLVTVGMVNFNGSPYVIDSLESIKAQTYAALELIVIDDCSSDESPRLIKEWLENYDKPYKYIIHEKNFGICKTCNDILSHANGKYISLIASDDMYLPEKINNQVQIMEEASSEVALVYTDTYLMNDRGARMPGSLMTTFNKIPFNYKPTGNVISELQYLHFIHPLSILVRKSVYEQVGHYDEDLPFEDYDMSIRIAKKFKVSYHEDIQVVYRVHDKSFSAKTKDWDQLLIHLYLKHADLYEFREKAKSIIWKYYLQGSPNVGKWAMRYRRATRQKFENYFFVRYRIKVSVFRSFQKLFNLFQVFRHAFSRSY